MTTQKITSFSAVEKKLLEIATEPNTITEAFVFVEQMNRNNEKTKQKKYIHSRNLEKLTEKNGVLFYTRGNGQTYEVLENTVIFETFSIAEHEQVRIERSAENQKRKALRKKEKAERALHASNVYRAILINGGEEEEARHWMSTTEEMEDYCHEMGWEIEK